MSVFEIIMLVCFGVAWPFSIHKSIVSKSVKGKSIIFLLIIWFGYVAGILHKILYHPDFVIVFYAINFTMVSVDVLLYLRNKRIANNKQ
jgi:hypothetical protein